MGYNNMWYLGGECPTCGGYRKGNFMHCYKCNQKIKQNTKQRIQDSMDRDFLEDMEFYIEIHTDEVNALNKSFDEEKAITLPITLLLSKNNKNK